MECSARLCKTTTSSEFKVFCDDHWGRLPRAYQQNLAEAYGTPGWEMELKKCIRQTFLMDSKRLSRGTD